MTSYLFVCTGNICRSPTAEAIARELSSNYSFDIQVDSAGVRGYHIGNPPDRRAKGIASRHGVDMSKHRARKLTIKDFHDFDYLIAMDKGHYAHMMEMAPKGTEHKIHLLLDFLEGFKGRDVIDPYYGGIEGFERVFNLIYRGCDAMLKCHLSEVPIKANGTK